MKPINLSPSFLSKVLSKGYDYAVAQKLGMIPSLPTQAMSDGKLLHALIAERLGNNTDKWVVSPYDNFRTKEAKEWRDSQPDDVIITNQAKIDQYNQIADRVINHPKIKSSLQNAKAEGVVEKRVGEYNVKGVLDVVARGEAITVIDWKFVSSTNFDKFDKVALYDNYDLQAAVYDFLVGATHVYFGVIENEAPYRIKLYWCDPSFLDSGANKFDKALNIIKEAGWREPDFNIEEVGTLVSWNNYNG